MPTKSHRTTLHRRRLASAIVLNYEPSLAALDADDEAFIVALQTQHGQDADWLPEPSVAQAILSAVRFDAVAA